MAKRQGKKEEQAPQVAAPTAANLPEGFKVKRSITLPVLVLKKQGDTATVLIQDAMRVSKVETKADASGKKREPATICTVVKVDSGEQFTMLVPAVVKANLLRDYPDDDYVGKTFMIQNMGKRTEAQRYNDFRIFEVEKA